MKIKHFLGAALAVPLVALFSNLALADLSSLTSYADDINTQNDGKGIAYTYSYVSGYEVRVNMGTAQPQLDLSAYSPLTQGNNLFQSFFAETGPGVYTDTDSYGKFNLVDGKSINSSQTALTVGAAYLYKMYATGELAGYGYSTGYDSYALQVSLRSAMGNTNWGSSDIFLTKLLAINSDRNYWLGAYDLTSQYDFMGDYATLILNCSLANGTNTQDVFYLAKNTNSSPEPTPEPASVPEPATLAFWGMISVLLPIGHKVCKRTRKTDKNEENAA